MCGTILAAIILIAVGIFVAKWVLIVLAVVFFFLMLDAYYRSKQCEKLTPTPMRCKNCGSSNVKIKARVTGFNHAGGGAYGGGLHFWQSATAIQRARVYECQDCGFSDYYTTQEDINAVNQLWTNRIGLYFILMVICIIAVVAMHYVTKA